MVLRLNTGRIKNIRVRSFDFRLELFVRYCFLNLDLEGPPTHPWCGAVSCVEFYSLKNGRNHRPRYITPTPILRNELTGNERM